MCLLMPREHSAARRQPCQVRSTVGPRHPARPQPVETPWLLQPPWLLERRWRVQRLADDVRRDLTVREANRTQASPMPRWQLA